MEKVTIDSQEYNLEDKDACFAKILLQILARLTKMRNYS